MLRSAECGFLKYRRGNTTPKEIQTSQKRKKKNNEETENARTKHRLARYMQMVYVKGTLGKRKKRGSFIVS